MSEAPLYRKDHSFECRIPVYLVIYDSGQVSLEYFLPSRYPSHQCNPDHAWQEWGLAQIRRESGPMLAKIIDTLHKGAPSSTRAVLRSTLISLEQNIYAEIFFL